MTLTLSDITALQIEHVAKMLPKMFPTKVVRAKYHYRYAWETTWRRSDVQEFTISDSALERLIGVSDESLVRSEVEARLKRYHWTDRAGRVRRVKEFRVYMDIPTITSSRKLRMPMDKL